MHRTLSAAGAFWLAAFTYFIWGFTFLASRIAQDYGTPFVLLFWRFALAFLLLTVHWFNPVLWAAYVLLGRDMENACDERVLRGVDGAGRAAYSRALVACAVRQRPAAVCPLAFGEVAVQERVKNAMNGKKPAVWSAPPSVSWTSLSMKS